MLTPLERSVLRVMLQAHGRGMDWLGLTNVAIPAGLSLDETAAADMSSNDTDFARFLSLRWRNPLA
jgi:hypothetical protein